MDLALNNLQRLICHKTKPNTPLSSPSGVQSSDYFHAAVQARLCWSNVTVKSGLLMVMAAYLDTRPRLIHICPDCINTQQQVIPQQFATHHQYADLRWVTSLRGYGDHSNTATWTGHASNCHDIHCRSSPRPAPICIHDRLGTAWECLYIVQIAPSPSGIFSHFACKTRFRLFWIPQ